MSLFWILIGLLAFCTPHLAVAGMGVAWPFAPFAGECALVILVLSLASARDAYRAGKVLPAAALSATLAVLVFEAVCALVFVDEPAGDALILVEELLHGASMALWCAYAILKGEGTSDENTGHITASVLAVSLAGVLAGGMWYALSSAAVAQPLAANQLELVLWLATAVWALPLVVLVWTLEVDTRQHAVIAAAPFIGAFVANRIWQFAVTPGVTFTLPFAAGIVLALPAVFSIGMLLVAWLLSDSDGEESVPEEENASEEATLPTTKLPIDQLAGYSALTERERQTVEASVAGATTDEIAAALGIASGTVSTYRSRAYAKLGVASTQELLSIACELLAHPRLYLEPDEEPAGEVSAQPVAATQTIPERFIPPVACVACAVAAMLVASIAHVIPVQEAPALVLCAVGVLFVLASCIKSPAECSAFEKLTAICIGFAAALALIAATLCPALYLVSRLVLLAVIVAAAAWCTWRSRGLWPKLGWRVLGASGPVLLAAAPASTFIQSFSRGLLPHLLAVLLLGIAVLVHKRAVADEASHVASIVLEGDERITAYLMGRGLPDLQAQVVLLTARGFAQGSIAKSLCISNSTVSEYRSRAYKTLDVHSKDQLVELLAAEAGL